MVEIVFEDNRLTVTGISKDLANNLEAKYSWFDCLDLNKREYFFKYIPELNVSHGFPGLFYILKNLFDVNNVPCKVSFGRNETYTPKHTHWKFTAEPRVGQLESIEAAFEKRIGLVKAPPGAGKTCIMTGITARVGGRTLILTQNEEPLLQALTAFSNYTTGIEPTLYYGNAKKKLSEVVIGTVQTFSNAIKKNNKEVLEWLKGVDICMIDESHHVATKTYQTVLEALGDPKFIIGVSATPEDREDESAMYVGALLGNVLNEISYGELIDAGSLVPVTIYVEKIPLQGEQKPQTFSSFDTTDGKTYADIREEHLYYNQYANQAAADFVDSLVSSGKSCAVIVGNITHHAKEMEKLIPYGVPLYGETENRAEIIRKLRNKEIMCVITTLFDEAVDVPSLDAVAVLAGGKSKIKLKQRIRSTRAFKGTTVLGESTKKRGYVWIPHYEEKYLKDHSKKRLKELKEIVAEHKLNELVMLD